MNPMYSPVPHLGIRYLLALCATLLLSLAPLPPAAAETVNLNRADAATLEANLTGIGPVRSRAIVEYRRRNGPFKSLDDLLKIPGIGRATLDKNRKALSLTRGAYRTERRARVGGKDTGPGSEGRATGSSRGGRPSGAPETAGGSKGTKSAKTEKSGRATDQTEPSKMTERTDKTRPSTTTEPTGRTKSTRSTKATHKSTSAKKAKGTRKGKSTKRKTKGSKQHKGGKKSTKGGTK